MAEETYTLATDEDFEKFVAECLAEDPSWREEYSSGETRVWSKPGTTSSINICKVRVVYPDIPPETLYDILHDHEYRKVWDNNMIEGIVIEQLSKRDEVGYYSAKVGAMVSNRDFVNQRSWRRDEEKGEWIIFNHSVQHKDYPEKKGFVRACSILTGYLILRNPGGGCIFIYLTQSDPKGWIPAWLINNLMTKLGPKLLTRMYDAAKDYTAWKTKQSNPNHKPWLEDK
eukprot:CAMPEP_0177648688 /NCGR_PEP_ID=MMETSP0447-20121125/10961_1 /TAXON_ID=0 /ORGANISM="Stygamoeba regulata, Strain BSH-02190019" /LENGTH=227 /DNA_ID=CAMNT_0019151345 /DNA_START=135 /DNA_END=818 /DNA_ORIENTATION=+